MKDNWFIDTNILLYAYDKEAQRKHQIAKELVGQCWKQDIGVISVQVLCEFFVRATLADYQWQSLSLLIDSVLSQG